MLVELASEGRVSRGRLEQFLNQTLRLLRRNAEIAKSERTFAGVQYRFQFLQRRQIGPAPE